MTSKDVLKHTLDMSQQVLLAYLGDLSDAELMERPTPESHHVAWSVGHLITSENEMLTKAGFEMPALPDGFVDQHATEAANSDDSADFRSKSEYMNLLTQQREGTLAALEKLGDSDFDKPAPESMQNYVKTIGEVFNLTGVHTLMHAGQFVPLRRRLGKAIVI